MAEHYPIERTPDQETCYTCAQPWPCDAANLQRHLTEEEQGWLGRSKAIVQQLMAMRRATGTLPTSMEEEQTNLERALYRLAEAREKLAAVKKALVLACANVGQDVWDKMSIEAKVEIIEALPASSTRRESD